VQALADEIGPRVAGTEAERQAAQYIAQQLQSYGYSVEMPEFPFQTFEDRGSTLRVVAPQPANLTPTTLRLSVAGNVEAEIVHVGLARPEDFPSGGLRGRIALIQRGQLTFSEKVANAEAAGAAAAIIYNSSPEPFTGSLREQSKTPAVSIPGAEGQELLDFLDRGSTRVRLSVQGGVSEGRSRNVVARPPGTACRVLVGGHYDSVPAAPGASDNASGTATLIEVARAVAPRSAELGVCFAAFGAEEVGLLGSQDLVKRLSEAERRNLKAMVNLDMVGVGSEWLLIGTPRLTELAEAEAEALGIRARVGSIPANTSSDHASFIAAGIPAVFINRSDDPLFHTPQDVSSRVRPQALEEAGRLTQRLVEVLATS
jgi:aminopeptidase YwaD